MEDEYPGPGVNQSTRAHSEPFDFRPSTRRPPLACGYFQFDDIATIAVNVIPAHAGPGLTLSR